MHIFYVGVYIYDVSAYISMFICLIYFYIRSNLRYCGGDGKAFCYLGFPSVPRPERESSSLPAPLVHAHRWGRARTGEGCSAHAAPAEKQPVGSMGFGSAVFCTGGRWSFRIAPPGGLKT